MTTEKKSHTFRTRRTPAEMAVARAAQAAPAQLGKVPSMTDIDGPEAPAISAAPPKDVSADQVQLMRQRAQERKEKALQDAAAQAAVVAAAGATKLQRWLYNSNTENISEFPEGYMVVEDGYFEYTPPANFPFTDEDKEVHLEFCRSRVNTKPVDGLGNAKLIRSNAERMLAQTTYMPPQPQTMNNGVLTVDTSI